MMQPGATAIADASQVEREILQEFERLIGSRTFNLWVRGNASIETGDGQVTVNVHNKFLLNWLQQRFRPILAQAVQHVLGDSLAVQFRELPVAVPVAAAANTSVTPPAELNRVHEIGGVRARSPCGAAPRARVAPRALDASPIVSIALHASKRQHKSQGVSSPIPSDRAAGKNLAGQAQLPRTPLAEQVVNSVGASPNPPQATSSSGGSARVGGSAQSGGSSLPPNSQSNNPHPNGPPPSGRRFADLGDFVTGPGNQLALSPLLLPDLRTTEEVVKPPGVARRCGDRQNPSARGHLSPDACPLPVVSRAVSVGRVVRQLFHSGPPRPHAGKLSAAIPGRRRADDRRRRFSGWEAGDSGGVSPHHQAASASRTDAKSP